LALRNIVYYPDPILKQVARPVKKFDQRLCNLLDDMAETMYKKSGVGLAAPQVAIAKQVVVVDVGEGLVELINPKIIAKEGQQLEPLEGCLSIPGYYGIVKRFKTIKVKCQKRTGDFFEFVASDFFARAIQHEIDHLNGILFIDRAEKIYTKDSLKNEVKEIRDIGEVKVKHES